MTNWSTAGPTIKVWAHGSCLNNGEPDAVGGVGAVIKPDDDRTSTEIYAPTNVDEKVTNPLAEYLAVIVALDRIEDEYSSDTPEFRRADDLARDAARRGIE